MMLEVTTISLLVKIVISNHHDATSGCIFSSMLGIFISPRSETVPWSSQPGCANATERREKKTLQNMSDRSRAAAEEMSWNCLSADCRCYDEKLTTAWNSQSYDLKPKVVMLTYNVCDAKLDFSSEIALSGNINNTENQLKLKFKAKFKYSCIWMVLRLFKLEGLWIQSFSGVVYESSRATIPSLSES